MNFFRRIAARLKRQPTLALQAVSAVLTYVVTYQIDGLSAMQAGAIVAVLSAVLGAYNAWKVRPVAPAVWQALVTTVAALLSAYGWHSTQEQVGSLQLAVISVMALLTWQSVSPASDPTLPAGPDIPDPAMATPRSRIAYR